MQTLQTFDQFDLSPGTRDAIAAIGYETPTPVQERAIPLLLAGQDVIVQARTGTGKTASFGIPLVERARHVEGSDIVALVLVPTRELAIQVSEELSALAQGSGVRVITIYGGVGFGNQNAALARRGRRILVATPGRLLDHLGRGNADLGGVDTLILDEADRMLDMGFLPDVERILKALPAKRQTGLFSATVPEPIRKLSQRFLHAPQTVRIESGAAATPLAEQFRVNVEKPQKPSALLAILASEAPERAIVFTRTKHLARRLAQNLGRAGHSAVALQGNMSQSQRERAMLAFREGEVRILVATDIASRGLDVPEVSHVVNYDLPDDPEAYVHRIGRTGRMGRTGRAFTFVQSDQHRDVRVVEDLAGSRMTFFDLGPLPEAPREPRDPGNGRHHDGGGRGGHGGPTRGAPQGGRGGNGAGGRNGRPRFGAGSGDGQGHGSRYGGGQGGSDNGHGDGRRGGGGRRSPGGRGRGGWGRDGERSAQDERRSQPGRRSYGEGSGGGNDQNHIHQVPAGRSRRRGSYNQDSGLY